MKKTMPPRPPASPPNRASRGLRARCFAALILSACGSPESRTAAAAVDPCTLLTEADARAILGDALQQGTPNAGSTPSCQYVAPSAESLTLQMLPGSVADFDSYVRQSAEAFDMPVEPAAGLGERAAWVGTTLIVLRAPHLLVINVGQDLSSEARHAVGQRLGTSALQRL